MLWFATIMFHPSQSLATMPVEVLNLTKKTVENLPAPERAYVIRDKIQKELMLRVSPTSRTLALVYCI